MIDKECSIKKNSFYKNISIYIYDNLMVYFNHHKKMQFIFLSKKRVIEIIFKRKRSEVKLIIVVTVTQDQISWLRENELLKGCKLMCGIISDHLTRM